MVIKKFSQEVIEQLRSRIIISEKSDSAEEKKKLRREFRKFGFCVSDFNIRNITSSDFNTLIETGKIKITSDYTTASSPKKEIKKTCEIVSDFESSLNLADAEYCTISTDFLNDLNYNGLYSLRLKNMCLLPQPFHQFLTERDHYIVYVGKAEEQTLKKRLQQELYAKGHGTFFRSIGAVLGYLPEAGSLYGKANQNNYKLKKEDEKQIILWIENNLEIAVFKTQDFKAEKHLICKLKPLLNDSHNPLSLSELRMAKEKCRTAARTNKL